MRSAYTSTMRFPSAQREHGYRSGALRGTDDEFPAAAGLLGAAVVAGAVLLLDKVLPMAKDSERRFLLGGLGALIGWQSVKVGYIQAVLSQCQGVTK